MRLCYALIFLAAIPAALAGSWTWTGNGGNVNWSTGNNWQGGAAPSTNATTTDLIFAGSTNTGASGAPLLNGTNPFTLNSLTFNSGSGSFFLGGSALTFNGSNITNTNTILQNSSSAQSIANDINNPIGKPTTLTLAGTGTGVVTLSGVISAAGSTGGKDYAITKSGTSTFALTGNNTYTGGTIINGGTLAINSINSLGTGALTINAGTLEVMTGFSTTRTIALNNVASTLQIDPSQTYTVTSAIAGTGMLNKTGTGTLVLSGANSYSGGTTISAGTLQLGASERLVNTAPITVSGGTFDMQTFSETVGAVSLSSGSIIGSGTLTGSAYAFDAGTVSAPLGGLTAALTKNTTGTLTLSGTNTYFGGTTINGGTVIVNASANLGNTLGGLTLNAGTLEIATSFASGTRVFTLGNAASTFQVDSGQTFTVSSVIGGSGTLNKTGAGTMIVTGVNLFSGGTNVIGGSLQLGGIDRLLTSATLTVAGGTFDVQTFGQTTGAFTLSSGAVSGSGTGTLTASTYTLQSGSVSAIMAGGGTVTKNTSGTVTLSASNTYIGSTTISAGTLQVNSNNALGSAASGTTVANGAALRLNGVNYSTAEPLTLNGSGISNGGALANTGTSTFAGPINAATNATINAGGGTLNLTGGVSKNGTTLTISGGGSVNITTNGITGSAANSDLVVDGTTVNENTANSYNGPTYIRNGGILNANVANALPTSNGRSPIILDDIGNGSSQLTLGAPQSVASLTGASSSLIALNGNVLTVGTSSGTTTFAGLISGTGALTKDGVSTQIFGGPNSYTGATTITGGTLTLANNSGSALGSTSSVTINSGGTVLLGHNDQIDNAAPLTLAGGTFAKGDFNEGAANSPGVGALTLTAASSHLDFGTGAVGVLTFASFTPGTFTLTIDNWTGTAGTAGGPTTDRLVFASDQSGNLSSFNFTGYSGAWEFPLSGGYYEVVPAPVPETSTWVTAAMAAGIALFHFVRRRRASTPAKAYIPSSHGGVGRTLGKRA